MREALHSAFNRLGFAWRNFAAVEWLPFAERGEDKTALFQDDSVARAKAEELTERYGLKDSRPGFTRARWKETLAFLQWLAVFEATAPGWLPFEADDFRWLDVGSRNWTYVEALYRFIHAHRAESFRLDGLEIDPNRRFANLRLRKQEAEFYAKPFSAAHYNAGSILDWREPVDVITHFLPFVFSDPHLDWGLPIGLFQPGQVLAHELSLLRPGGVLLIVNQDEDEAAEQERLLIAATGSQSFEFQATGRLPDSFVQYRYPRYGWICRKSG